jgi:hypothetical protein
MRREPGCPMIDAMIVTFGALAVAIAVAALALSAGIGAVLVRLLEHVDAPPAGEPAWWPEFERRFAEYLAAQQAAS